MPDEIELPNEVLERHEHAEHVRGGREGPGHGDTEHGAGHSAKGHAGRVTLLILALAMAAAICGKISAETEIRYLTAEIELSDTWGQYQGKSDREAMSQGFARLASALPSHADPATAATIAAFTADAARLDSDEEGEGKQQLVAKARTLEAERTRLANRMEGFSVAVVMLAISIGLGSASMLSRARQASLTLAGIASALGVGAVIYGLLVGLSLA